MACASVAGGALCVASVAAPATVSSYRSSLAGSRLSVSSIAPLRTSVFHRARGIVAMSSPIKPKQLFDDLVDKIKESISTAQEVCFGNEDSDECVVAWDEVEELSAAAAHKKQYNESPGGGSDPLDKYCEENPETDECRVYED